jgi:hypothetical protein
MRRLLPGHLNTLLSQYSPQSIVTGLFIRGLTFLMISGIPTCQSLGTESECLGALFVESGSHTWGFLDEFNSSIPRLSLETISTAKRDFE